MSDIDFDFEYKKIDWEYVKLEGEKQYARCVKKEKELSERLKEKNLDPLTREFMEINVKSLREYLGMSDTRRVYINNNIKQGDIFNTDYFFSCIEGEFVITKRVKDRSVIIHSVLDFYNLLREGCITINKEEGVKNESVAINNAKQVS